MMKSIYIKNKNLLLGLASSLILLIAFYILFDQIPTQKAKEIDIQWGFYLVLLQFIFIAVGFLVNQKDIFFSLKKIQNPKKHSLILLGVLLFFGIFTSSQVNKQHRVLSDETSWESLGLMMIHHHNGGVCNEGFYQEDRSLNCQTTVNNFKGKSTPFAYYLSSFVTEFNRDVALQLNFYFYLASLVFIYLILIVLEQKTMLALLTSLCLGAFPKLIFQAQTATTEVLYIFCGLLSLLVLVLLKKNGLKLQHLLLIVPLMGFFSGTRLETVFAFGFFTVLLLPLFREKKENLPIFVASTFAMCLPAIITIAAYKGYDFQGGKYEAHSLANLISNFKENIEIMLQLKSSPEGLMISPFSTTQTVWLYAGTLFLTTRLIFSSSLKQWFWPALLFFMQPLVIMFNVSGTFAIDINQRYVLIALPLFAFIMARSIYELNQIIKDQKIRTLIWISSSLLCLAIPLVHTKSFNANIHYQGNKLLAEEAFLNDTLKTFPKNSVFFYSRPWQMLASGFDSWSESSMISWSQDSVLKLLSERQGNLYVVRGQDGYGNVNLNSKVIGFKTTRTQELLQNRYECREIISNIKDFGYPLKVCKIEGLKRFSPYRNQITSTLDLLNNQILISKTFEESLSISNEGVELILSDKETRIDLRPADKGFQSTQLFFKLPDNDTLTHFLEWFKPGLEVSQLNEIPFIDTKQDWGTLGINKSINGSTLKVQNKEFKIGYGTHANSQIRFNLKSNWKFLHFGYGIDDEEACGDGVEFEIRLDGVKIWSDGPIFIGKYKKATVPLNKAKVLSLIVNSNNNINCDHADWLHPWVQK